MLTRRQSPLSSFPSPPDEGEARDENEGQEQVIDLATLLPDHLLVFVSAAMNTQSWPPMDE